MIYADFWNVARDNGLQREKSRTLSPCDPSFLTRWLNSTNKHAYMRGQCATGYGIGLHLDEDGSNCNRIRAWRSLFFPARWSNIYQRVSSPLLGISLGRRSGPFTRLQDLGSVGAGSLMLIICHPGGLTTPELIFANSLELLSSPIQNRGQVLVSFCTA